MGDPKNPRKNWRKPKRPLNYDLLNEELFVLGTFGLKNKRELWKAHTELSRIPYQARQAVVHGHVMIGDRIVTIPSYTVKVEEEGQIHALIGTIPNQPKPVIETMPIEEPRK